MASEAPDPKTFQSWEEAFQYPIPVVRGMERQLRQDVESNREKLRTLVGASYRDLLGTAESIIEMDKKMHRVEHLMEDIGRKCNSRILEQKSANYKVWKRSVGERATEAAQLAFTSQMAVLRGCSDVISDILRTGKSLLLAAKVLVISRLLHTKLSKRAQPPPYLETLRARLATLRRRLLGRIERRFKTLETTGGDLVEAMCAFALATSSGPTNVVRHLHQLRLEAMEEWMGSESAAGGEGQQDVLKALRLYVKTLQDTKAYIPGQLGSALQKLRTVATLKGGDLKGLIELNLDIHERWIGEDIKEFTPFIRHDELGRAETEKMLNTWARSAVRAFLAGLKGHVDRISRTEQLMTLRREVLDVWLSQKQYSRLSVDAEEVLDGMRDVFNTRAVDLVKRQTNALEDVSAIIEISVLAEWKAGVSDKVTSLWSPELTSMDTSNGALKFRQKLVDLSTGKNDDLVAVCESYETWHTAIQNIESMIQDTKKIKWDESIDDVEDDDGMIEDRQVLLSVDDPRGLEDALRDGLADAFKKLEQALHTTYENIESEDSVYKAVFLLRTLRELRSNFPSSFNNIKLSNDLVSTIHSKIATSTIHAPLETCSARLRRFTLSPGFPTRALWEGEPELPVLPSLWAYRFLLDLTQAMAELGPDIWSPEAVKVLRREAVERLRGILNAKIEEAEVVNGDNGHGGQEEGKKGESEAEDEEAETEEESKKEEDAEEKATSEDGATAEGEGQGEEVNGVDVNGEKEQVERDPKMEKEKMAQKLFDSFYLGTALRSKDQDKGGLEDVQASIVSRVELEAKAVEQMRKGASEYWKRTSLLFGLLA